MNQNLIEQNKIKELDINRNMRIGKRKSLFYSLKKRLQSVTN